MTPYYDKIEVKPFRVEKAILSEKESLAEVGEVIAVGRDVTFVKPGDMIFFDSWGCSKTEYKGEVRYLVSERSDIILGKQDAEKSV